jgi:hypothetical protein
MRAMETTGKVMEYNPTSAVELIVGYTLFLAILDAKIVLMTSAKFLPQC